MLQDVGGRHFRRTNEKPCKTKEYPQKEVHIFTDGRPHPGKATGGCNGGAQGGPAQDSEGAHAA